MVAAAKRLGAMLEGGETLLLDGPMGGGKTTFTRALAEGLGVDRPHRVRSPTYTLSMRHRGRVDLVHVDLFRSADGGEAGFEALGLGRGAVDGETGVTDSVLVVEWAEMWATPPAEALELSFLRPTEQDAIRQLRVSGRGPGGAELAQRWLAALPESL